MQAKNEAKVEVTNTNVQFGIKEILFGMFVNGKDLASEVNAAIDAAYKEK
jgi:hypothetical protein